LSSHRFSRSLPHFAITGLIGGILAVGGCASSTANGGNRTTDTPVDSRQVVAMADSPEDEGAILQPLQSADERELNLPPGANGPAIRRTPPQPQSDFPANPEIEERFLFENPVLRDTVSLTWQDVDEESTGGLFDAVGAEAKSQYVRGAFLNQSGYSSQAYEAFRAAVTRDPENLWLKLRAGRAALFLNDVPQAQRYAEEILDIEPDNYRAMLLLAQIYMVRERIVDAQEWYEKAHEVKPLNIEALENLARLAYRRQDLEGVKEYAGRIFEVTSRNLTAILLHAEASALTGDITYAAELYEQLIRARPSLISQVEDMGLRLIRQGRGDEAIELFRRGVAMQPSNTRIRDVWEESIRQIKGEEAIRGEYEELGAESPLDLRIQELVAGFYERSGDRESLVEHRERMLEIEPRHVQSLLSLAKISLEDDDLDRANELFERAIDSGPQQPSVFRDIAMVYLDQERYDRAEELLRSARALDPDDVDTFIASAALAEAKGDEEQMEKFLREALDASPGNPVVLEILGQYYARNDQWRNAAAVFEQALASNPGDAQIQLALAHAYLEQNNQRSLDILEQDNRFAVKGFAFYSGYGMLTMEFGEYARARWALEKALELTPGAIGIRVSLAESYVHLGEAELAEETLTRGREYYPDTEAGNRQYQLNLMYVFTNTRQFDRALRQAELLRESFPEDRRILSIYYSALKDAGRSDEVLERLPRDAERVADNDSPEEAIRFRAQTLSMLGNNQEALRLLKPLEGPEFDAMLAFDLALNHGELKDAENVSKYYRKIIENVGEEDRENFWVYVNAHNNLAYFYAKQNINLQEALELASRALELRPRADYILDTYGYVHFRLGNFDKAERYMKMAEKISLPDPEIMENLGDLYRAMDRPALALEYYEQALDLDAEAEGLQAKIDEVQTLLGAAR